MNTNVITAVFGALRETKVRPRYRYNRGQVLVLKGIRDLPDFYEVHFANIGGEVDATPEIGTAEGVIIPDRFFESAAGILAYIYVHDEATDGTTIYKVTIPIIDRPRPADTEPTQEEADIISQAIVALNENVGRAEESAATAQSAADGAAQAERNAGVSAERAEAAEQAAETSATGASSSAAAAQAAALSAAESESQASAHKDAAMVAADNADAASASASDHASAAQSAAAQAEQYKNTAVAAGNAAQTAATNAGAARTAAEAAQTAAEGARSAAEIARTDAQTYAGQASQSATDAAQSAAGAAQTIGQVRAEGAAQIAAVDAEGQRVLDSIPEDYSQMEDDITDLKSQIGQITRTTRNMFDDSAFLAAGLIKGSDGYWYGTIRAWNTAFSSLLPVSGTFEDGKQYTISCKYYFSDIGSFVGNAMSIKVGYTDNTSVNVFQFNASYTTETSVSQETSSAKNTDHLFTALTDSRAYNYTLHVKEFQVEEGNVKTAYTPHIVVYDAALDDVASNVNEQIAAVNAEVNSLAENMTTLEWEVGFYNSSTGAKQTTTNTVRTINLIYLIAGTNIYVDGGYMYRLYRYTANDLSTFVEYYEYSYDSTLHYITGYYEIPVTGWYGIVVADYAMSTVTDAATVGAHVHIEPFVALNDLKNAVSLGIMPYNLEGLKTYIDTVVGMGGDVVIPLVTDIHGGYPDTYAVINYLANSGIGNYMFEMGDVIKATYPTRAEAVDYLRESFHTMAYTATNTPIIMLQGNHDTNPLSGTDTSKNVTQEIFYGLSMARPKNIHQPARKAYGYADIEAAKVRIIYLNTSDIYDATTGAALVTGQYTMIQRGQLDWFCGTALDLSDKDTPTDWSVIIVSHDSLSQVAGSAVGAILTAFMAGTTASGTQTVTVGTYSNVLTYNCDFTAQGGITVICEVNGHHHKDMIRELGSTGIKQVYVACEGPASASYDDDGSTVYYTRNRGTTDEHLIDTLVLDKANRKVYFKRFGVGADREITY